MMHHAHSKATMGRLYPANGTDLRKA